MDSRVVYSLVIVACVIIITGGYIALIGFGNNPNEVTIAGSTTVLPVAQALADAYMKKHPEVKITVHGRDSNLGIDSVRSGSVDIGTSSRKLTGSESDGLSQYKIGDDAIAIVVNNQNQMNGISLDQLSQIYNGNINNWNQLGGENASITPINREVGSGTRVDFEEMVGNTTAKGITTTSSTYEAMHTVAVSPNAIGYISQNAINDQLKVLKVNNITLNLQSMTNGSYPLKRPMLLLVKGTPTGTIKDFIDFCLSPEGQNIVNEVEYANSSVYQNPGIGPAGG